MIARSLFTALGVLLAMLAAKAGLDALVQLDLEGSSPWERPEPLGQLEPSSTRPSPRLPAVAAPDPEALLSDLAGIGYVDWDVPSPEPPRTGVVRGDFERMAPGLTLFSSAPRSAALLIDAEGRVLHEWTCRRAAGEDAWSHVQLLDGGDLLAITEYERLERLAWNSERRWSIDIGAHHDLDIDEEGRIHVLVGAARLFEFDGELLPIFDNGVAVLSPEGELLEQRFLADVLGDLPELRAALDEERREMLRQTLTAFSFGWSEAIEESREGLPDLFHANSIVILPRDLPGVARRGDVLLSIRNLDLVAIVDLAAGAVRWTHSEGLDEQHHATLLDRDTVLLFDNGTRRGWSRILELDPATGEPVWEHAGSPRASFFTRRRGAVQRLPNGNHLVSLSDSGRALELGPEGEVVWEFLNEDVEELSRARVYRFERISPQVVATLPLNAALRAGSEARTLR